MFPTCKIRNICDCYTYVFDDVVFLKLLSLQIFALVCDISVLSFSCLCVQAARETGALQAAKNKLEKQVEELTWRLQLEKRMRVGVIMAMNPLRVVSSCSIVLLV